MAHAASLLFLWSQCAAHSHLRLWITLQTRAHAPSPTSPAPPTLLLWLSGHVATAAAAGPCARRGARRCGPPPQERLLYPAAFLVCLLSMRPQSTDGGRQRPRCLRMLVVYVKDWARIQSCVCECAQCFGSGCFVWNWFIVCVGLQKKPTFSGNKTHTLLLFLSHSLSYMNTNKCFAHSEQATSVVLYRTVYSCIFPVEFDASVVVWGNTWGVNSLHWLLFVSLRRFPTETHYLAYLFL